MERNINSRRRRSYGALNSLFNRDAALVAFRNNCNACGTCHTFGSCHNCGCHNCGSCNTVGCVRAASDCDNCTTCSGSNLFFTGCCGPVSTACPGVCAVNTCGGCNNCNNCNNCNTCSGCGCNNCRSGCNDCGCDNCGCNNCGCNDCGCDNCGCDNCRSGCNDCGCNDCGCDNCGCNNCRSRCNNCCSCASGVSAMFTAMAPISVSDGGQVQLEMEDGDTEYFQEHGGRIRILRSGTYHAMFTVSVPEEVDVCARLAMAVEGQRIFPSETEINTDSSGHNKHYTGHAVFTVSRGEHLTLMSAGELRIPESSGAAPTVHLSIIRLR